jgi:hypothetical protein
MNLLYVFNYKFAIYEGNKRISLSFDDVTAQDSLRPLLAFLQDLASEQPRKGNSRFSNFLVFFPVSCEFSVKGKFSKFAIYSADYF